MIAGEPIVQPGCIELLRRARELLGGGRVGLLAHAASVLPDFTHLADRLREHPDVRLTALFGPEHGLDGAAQDMIGVDGAVARGLPIFSLYGAEESALRPTAEMLATIDALVVDLQDVGARYYTFVYTMAYCLEACAAAGKRVIVCDRPNPLNGVDVDGPLLEPAFASFVGRFPLPVRHGKTIGELAQQWNREQGWNADLTVLPCAGWDRAMWFDQTGLPWIPPSPNMPTLDTATVYPGACLVEGTNLSEGRGTTRPFETIGAPWLDGRALAAELNASNLPGVRFRPLAFVPAFHKHAGRNCGGVFVHVTDRSVFRAVDAYVQLIAAARRQHRAAFAWRTEPYEFVRDRLAFDLLCGTDRLRRQIEAE